MSDWSSDLCSSDLLLRGGVDRNLDCLVIASDPCRRLLRGGVDRNLADIQVIGVAQRSPPARRRGSKPEEGNEDREGNGSPPARRRGSKDRKSTRLNSSH